MKTMMDNEMIEHVAVWAAERGDWDLESLCDDVLAGETDSGLVADIVRNDETLQEWCSREKRVRS